MLMFVYNYNIELIIVSCTMFRAENGGHMRKKNDIEVLIVGTRYTLCGYESSEYMLRIASYINEKLEEITKNTDPRLMDNETRNVLLHINIADDYFKELARNEALSDEKSETDKALFELKHEIVKVNEQTEKLARQNKQLKQELEEEKKKSSEALSMLENEKKRYMELENTINELLEDDTKS